MNLINGKEVDFRFAGIDKYDFNNGNGVGVTLFVQGCSHHCKECQNISTWNKDGGLLFKQNHYDEIFDILSRDIITRFTISGGDPFDNLEFSYFIAKDFKEKFPNKKLWIYTGYLFENILGSQKEKLLKLCDVLVDGEFKIELKNLRLQFRGSSNQRIINVQESLKNKNITLWRNKKL